MDKPKFFYQNCPAKYPGYVAVMAQFLPTFDSKETVTDSETKSDAETAGATYMESQVGKTVGAKI